MFNIWRRYMDEMDDDGGDGGGVTDTSQADSGTETPPAGDWAPDWRAKISADPKHAKTLERFTSPKEMFNSYVSLRQKVDSGELKAATEFPEKGTPEQQAEWRKANGIPEDPNGYTPHFPDGLVLGENDKEFVESFLASAHQANASPQQVNQMLHWYYSEQERALDKREEMDAAYLTETEDTLRAEWGAEYRTNINMIKGMVNTMPESVRDLFTNARLGDGNALLNNPDIARWLAHTARTVNPVATVVPGAGANIAGAIDDEIGAIEKVMRTDRKAYNADPKMQQRLRDLYDARERAK